jgi:hypothetical protein
MVEENKELESRLEQVSISSAADNAEAVETSVEVKISEVVTENDSSKVEDVCEDKNDDSISKDEAPYVAADAEAGTVSSKPF